MIGPERATMSVVDIFAAIGELLVGVQEALLR
jgi:hypothetical protein